MILVKNSNSKRKRDISTINIEISEYPKRPTYGFKSEREMVKFIKKVESIVRSSQEYKEYIQFMKKNLDLNRCAILSNIANKDGSKYSIEIHHEPFNLFQITQIVLAKHQILGYDINPFKIANEVMELHYDGKVGLIPLSKTQHELVGNGKIFIPLQYIYQNYNDFVKEYEEYIPEKINDLIQFKVDMSLRCDKIQSDCLTPEFIYVKVDGFDLPRIPKEWGERKQLLESSIENPIVEEIPVFKLGDSLEKYIDNDSIKE